MGTQSNTHPSQPKHAPIRNAFFIMLCFVSCLVASAQTPTVSALTIPLILPSAIVFDAAGNLYFAETGRHLIRKLDAVGNITTIAGTGTQGFSGDAGPATAATLDSPQGLALDTANNLYIADSHNHRIRQLNLATGTLITIAGSAPGFSGDTGPATSAQLNLPTALALDAGGNLYIADTGNHRIRKLTLATGVITTIAGNGTQGFSGDNGLATSAAIDSPTGLAVDAAANLYLADTHNHLIRKITSSTGTIATIAGNGSPGFSGDTAVATAATLTLPHGLSLDGDGDLYLADTENHRIRRIDAVNGVITTVAGDGTQAFSGDNGPAIAASLDSPRVTALSPANLLTLSDTGNQRIRQLTAQPAANTTITTIAGLGILPPGVLTLSAPATMPYGAGQLSASFAAASYVNGTITFLDITNATTGATITLGAAAIVSNVATLPITTLSVGVHTLIATYSGDQTHPSAQSQILALTITPLPLSATSASITRLYGQPIPTINGTVTGILPQDAANVTASFTTAATSMSPAGTYPISVTLSGPSAGNYTITMLPAFVTVNPAPTSITLSNLVANAASGAAVTLTTYVASTTTGTPTGSVTLLDGAVPLFTTQISTTGAAVFTTNSLATGSHTLTAVYNGSTNFTPSSSSPQLITIGTGSSLNPDFTLVSTGAISQTILSGTSANFTFSVQMQGNLSSAITLAAVGLPNLATGSFNPPTLPPGISAFTLTIATPNTTAFTHRPFGIRPHLPISWTFLVCPIAGVALGLRKRNKTASLFMIAIVSLPLMLIVGCGDRINTADALSLSAKTYTITVTGTATAPSGSTLQHSTTVTLLLAPAS
jgi:sugar lactone lactonase YvrE